MRFEVVAPDYHLSPFTGMTRRHWSASANFLLDGVFSHIRHFEDPVVFPKRSKIAYPHPNATWFESRAEEAEGLARTFMLAAPIIEATPALTIRGYDLRDYYSHQLLQASDPTSPRYLGKASEISRENGGRPCQQMVEGAALCLGLKSSQKSIWERYSDRERDQIAALLSDYAHHRTYLQNWRFFNVLMATFLKVNGYPVDEQILQDHLQTLLAYYAGDGWYRDGTLFDYYSPWAFQFYGPIWCAWYGYRHAPEIAAIIEQRHGELMKTYPYLFSRQGHSLLWGRSAVYRCAASAPFVSAFFLEKTNVDPGWARRIASGNLLQFIAREDTWHDGIPCLGFYGPFDEMLQSYSCSASPFWLSKIYQALVLPAESPFWTAPENEGQWATIDRREASAVLSGPGLIETIHGGTGAAECRPGKVAVGSPQTYLRLVMNSEFPWEASDPCGATAMTYVVRKLDGESAFLSPIAIKYVGVKQGVLYRRMMFFDDHDVSGSGELDLAEIIIPGGMLRVDRIRIPYAYELHLGHFGLPHLAGRSAALSTLDVEGHPAIIGSIAGRQLAMVAHRGWDALAYRTHTGKNAETADSTVIYARRKRETYYSGMDLLVTLMLHRTDDAGWEDSQLEFLESVEYLPWAPSGSPCGLRVRFRDGRQFLIDFANLEGELMI